jgi:hypothetical protein
MVRSRTQAKEFFLVFLLFENNMFVGRLKCDVART